MKLLIASDIHGSAVHCGRLFEAYEREKPDKILLLGDELYHGPRNHLPDDYDTKRTTEILNSMKEKIIAVKGNCDSEVDQMVLDFPIMNKYELIETDGLVFFATHGHTYNPELPPPFAEFDVMLNGHTHISVLQDRGGFYYVNPGSTSIPKDGTENSYMTYEDRCFVLHRLVDGTQLGKMNVGRKRSSEIKEQID